MRPKSRHHLVLVAIVAATLAGCTSWRVQAVSPAEFVATAKPGKVRVERADASRMVLHKPVVVGDSIRGAEGVVAVRDVTAISVRKFNGLRTAGLVGGILVGLGVGCAVTQCIDYDIGNIYGTARVGR